MDRKTYERTTAKEFIGRRVVGLVPMKTGMYSVPPGKIFTIEDKQGGFNLLSDPCPHCGIRVFIRGVQPQNVDLYVVENHRPGEYTSRGGYRSHNSDGDIRE